MNQAATPEPAPTGDGEIVLDFFRELAAGKERHSIELLPDLEARAEMGFAKYGTFLRTNNGRNALNDLYQEALDGVMYAAQFWLEEDVGGIGDGEIPDGLVLLQAAEEFALSVKHVMEARGEQ